MIITNRSTAVLIAALALAGGAVAPATAAITDPPKQEDAAKTDDGAKKFCVVQETTGTILKKRECYTRTEWIRKTGKDPLAKKKN